MPNTHQNTTSMRLMHLYALLAENNRRAARGYSLVGRQVRLIRNLRTEGKDTAEAKALLNVLKQSLPIFDLRRAVLWRQEIVLLEQQPTLEYFDRTPWPKRKTAYWDTSIYRRPEGAPFVP